jgi:hypothetical protein
MSRLFKATTFLVLLLLAACGDDPVAPAHDDVAGAWILESIDGAALPTVVSETESCVVRAVEGTLTFRSATRVRLLMILGTECIDFQEVLLEQTGGDFIYEYTAGALELTEPGRATPSLTGTVSGATLSITDGNSTLAFRR